MKRTALFAAAWCAISSGVLAQSSRSMAVSPAFESRFGGAYAPVVALHSINRSSAFQTRSFGGSTYSTDRGRLDPNTMNIRVFPGNTVLVQPQVGSGSSSFGFPGNAASGNTGFFIQQSGGSGSLQQVDPFRTTATPEPAVNLAAPIPATPQLQPTAVTMVSVQQQIVPAHPVPIAPNAGAPIQPQPIGSGQ